jgi:hypothetical protein
MIRAGNGDLQWVVVDSRGGLVEIGSCRQFPHDLPPLAIFPQRVDEKVRSRGLPEG